MGCSESKVANVGSVYQCKERKAFMKQSVSAHAAFVSAHYAYSAANKSTGVALCEYVQLELQSPPPHPPYHSVCPPRRENDGILPWDFFLALMEDVREPSVAVVDNKRSGIQKPAIRRNVVENRSKHGHGGEGPPPSSVKGDVRNVNLLKVLRKLDDGFIKASASACEVSKIHDANKLHYHSNVADNKGQIKHPARVIKVINNAKVDFSSKEKETHATLLEKMLAWENKLYDQVKAGEVTKHEYQKQTALLNSLRKRGASSDRLKRAEATVNHLHASYIVDTQSIDSTVSEINRLRDEQLYPKLVQIAKEMGEMWTNTRKQHEQQLTSTLTLINIKLSQSPTDTSERNLKNIEQIHRQLTVWRSEFENLMLHQTQYIKSLNSWLKLNLISTDHNLKPQNPKIESMLRTWNDQIEKLPEEGAKSAISSFAAVTATIVQYHSDEMKMKERCDGIRREIERKSRKFEEWCDKQISKRDPTVEMDVDGMDDMDVIAEQEVVVEELKRRLREEEEAYRRYRVEVKDEALMKMKTALPEVFTAMMEFSCACSRMYDGLELKHAITRD